MENTFYSEFINIFNKKHEFEFFAPGRVNLIGEHIDYNGGLVFPSAITFGTKLLIAKNNSNEFRFRTKNFQTVIDIPLAKSYKKLGKAWFNYPLGVIQEFTDKGIPLQGLDLYFEGNIPIGSGLSSSASIEIVTAFALNCIFDAQISLLDLVKMSKKVENNFIGVNSGIMDQFAISFGQKDKAILLNCNTLDYEMVPCALGDYNLAIINTNKPRTLADSKYNERVEECQTALKNINKELNLSYLCELNLVQFQEVSHLIEDEVVKNRALHIVTENQRVFEAKAALSAGDLNTFGTLMYASHDSLRNLYEVSGVELDTVIDYCLQNNDVAGARMTGAGFGGCAIALIKKGAETHFENELNQFYQEKIGYAPTVYISEIGNGVHQLN